MGYEHIEHGHMHEQLFETGKETHSVDFIFEAPDTTEFKIRINTYVSERKNDTAALMSLIDALYVAEEQANTFLSTQLGAPENHTIKNNEDIRAYYERTVPTARIQKKNPFDGFLYGYVKEAIKLFEKKYEIYVRAGEQLKHDTVAAEATERELALSSEQAEVDKKAEALIPNVRAEFIAYMEHKGVHHDHSAEHQKEIVAVKSFALHQTREAQENEKSVFEAESLLGALIEKKYLFGENASVFHTDRYDDYFTHADLAVDIQDGPLLLIDITNRQENAGEKQYYNMERPVRTLAYPPTPAIKDCFGIPVVLGITKADADEVIHDFLKDEARARVSGKESALAAPTEGVVAWADYVLVQLERQRAGIKDAFDKAGEGKEYVDALREYDFAITYFEKLKKERYPRVKIGQRSWDRRILQGKALMGEYALREGLNPNPEIQIPPFSAR